MGILCALMLSVAAADAPAVDVRGLDERAPIEAPPIAVERLRQRMHIPGAVWSPGQAAPHDGASAPEADGVLFAMAKSADPRTRLYAMEGLAESAAPEALDYLIDALADAEAPIRAAAARGLARLEGGMVYDRVMAIYTEGSTRRIRAVDDALPLLEDSLEPRWLDVLANDTAEPIAVEIAAYGLGRLRSREAAALLAERAWSAHPGVSLRAAQALAAVEAPSAVPWLTQLLSHRSPDVRKAALEGLAAIGGPAAVAAVGGVVAGDLEPDKALHQYAVVLLTRSGKKAAVPYLIAGLAGHPASHGVMTQALGHVTGQPFGTDTAKWIEWYQGQETKRSGPPAWLHGEPIRPPEIKVPELPQAEKPAPQNRPDARRAAD